MCIVIRARLAAVTHVVTIMPPRWRLRSVVSTLVLALSPVATFAQAARLDTVVVTASRSMQQVVDALPHTSVITRAEIEASQAADVLSLLRRQPGLEMAQNGGLGGVASVFMRGTNSAHVLLLVDGVRLNAVGSGAPAWSQLMLDDIERIEIVRGNVSALYGSEAIGGVVQIFTRSGGRRAALQLQAGGNRTRVASASVAGETGVDGSKTRASINVSSRATGGFSSVDASRAPAANTDVDNFRNRSASARVTQQIGAHEVGLTARSSRSRRDFDDPTDYSFFGPYNGQLETHKEVASLDSAALHARLRLGDRWESSLRLGQMRDLSDNTSSFPASFVVGRTSSRSREVSWQNVFEFSPSSTLTAGLEHLNQDATATAYTGTFTRRVDSAMLGYTGKSGAHEAQLNVRHDRYSDFGQASTGLVAYGFHFAPSWKAIAQVSNAFRAPSFNDLYFPFFGNPALKPERARSVELGLQYAQGDDLMRVAAYRNRISELIVFDAAIGLANNVAAARINGLELSGRTRWQDWDWSANLTLQRPIDATTGQRLLRRAAHTLNLGAARSWGAWRVAGDVQFAGHRYDSDITTFARVRLAGYALANLTVSHALKRNLSLGLSLQNALNARYRLVDGYNTPGRVVLVSLAARL